MDTENLQKNVLLVELPCHEPRVTERLKTVNELVSNDNSNDVIIDFSKVEIINSSNISNLLILRQLLQDSGHRLILCNVSVITKCIFVVAGLAEIFTFVDNPYAAFEAVQSSRAQNNTESTIPAH
jgi:anti-anti-sigma factor